MQLLSVHKHGDKIEINDFGGYQSRNPSTIKIMKEPLSRIKKDLQFFVNTGDKNEYKKNTLYYSSFGDDFSKTCPDFIYDCWKEAGIQDYEEKKISMYEAGKESYKINKIGWIGSITSNKRKEVHEFSRNTDFLDIKITHFQKKGQQYIANNFLTLEQQVKEWKYLLDIEGNGYSGRLKLLIGSQRPVFLVDRIYKEFYHQFMKPWVHYIPVKNDLSDFKENFDIVEKDLKLYERIVLESTKFSTQFLTREFAKQYWVQLLNTL